MVGPEDASKILLDRHDHFNMQIRCMFKKPGARAQCLRFPLLTMKPAIPSIAAAALAPDPAPAGHPLLRLGFRPFYLGATLFAAVALPVWVALFLGRVSLWDQQGLRR
jgi:hypothetical protein